MSPIFVVFIALTWFTNMITVPATDKQVVEYKIECLTKKIEQYDKRKQYKLSDLQNKITELNKLERQVNFIVQEKNSLIKELKIYEIESKNKN